MILGILCQNHVHIQGEIMSPVSGERAWRLSTITVNSVPRWSVLYELPPSRPPTNPMLRCICCKPSCNNTIDFCVFDDIHVVPWGPFMVISPWVCHALVMWSSMEVWVSASICITSSIKSDVVAREETANASYTLPSVCRGTALCRRVIHVWYQTDPTTWRIGYIQSFPFVIYTIWLGETARSAIALSIAILARSSYYSAFSGADLKQSYITLNGVAYNQCIITWHCHMSN